MLAAPVQLAVAYPELVSRGVSKSRKFKWLVKVGACKDVNPLIKKNHGRGGVSGQPENPPGYVTGWCVAMVINFNILDTKACSLPTKNAPNAGSI